MAPPSVVPQQPENTAFIKELQWKENKSQDEFLGNLLSDDKISKDHIALKHSSSSGSGGCGASKCEDVKPVVTGSTAKARDDPDIYSQLSINLWKRINAGYLVPRRPPTGVSKSVFTYDPSLIDDQSMEFHRKRNFYSEYNEAAARFKLVHGNKKPLSKPNRAGKVGEKAAVVNGRSSPPPLSAESAGANWVSTNNADVMKSNTGQIDQNVMPTTDTNPTGQSSLPTTMAAESKPTEPTS